MANTNKFRDILENLILYKYSNKDSIKVSALLTEKMLNPAGVVEVKLSTGDIIKL